LPQAAYWETITDVLQIPAKNKEKYPVSDVKKFIFDCSICRRYRHVNKPLKPVLDNSPRQERKYDLKIML
jgi:hypothetical protein